MFTPRPRIPLNREGIVLRFHCSCCAASVKDLLLRLAFFFGGSDAELEKALSDQLLGPFDWFDLAEHNYIDERSCKSDGGGYYECP